ncbi:MAG TPA: hypothetical protein VJ783_08140 [Pirellulales bacterium]|nr:hypothetical protein [Pirellulales bacterium]
MKTGPFGHFGLLQTTGESLKSLHGATGHRKKLSPEDARLIVRAFEDVRKGAAPDRILWDPELAERFDRRCRKMGLAEPAAALRRSLLNIRKNSARYAKRGIRISPTTKSEPQPSVLPQYAHAIEFALVRLRYRHGASIDEILLDPDLGQKFEQLALSMAPDLSSSDVRLGALYIRKTRHLPKKERNLLESLDTRAIDDEWSDPVDLSCRHYVPAATAPGLVEVKEAERCLYVSRTDEVASCVEQLCTGKAFEALASPFWTPDPAHIGVRYIFGDRIHGVTAHRWELRLIAANEPVFNWPVRSAA